MRTAPALAGSLGCYWRRKTKQIKEGDRDIRTTCGGEKKKKKKKTTTTTTTTTYGWEPGWERKNDIKNKIFWEMLPQYFYNII